MFDQSNTVRMVFALAITAIIVYFGIPALMGIPTIAEILNRFIIHTRQPIITGLAIGAGIGIIGSIVYFNYSLIKKVV